MTQEDLQDKIKDWWGRPFKGSKFFQVAYKLRFVKDNLKKWNRQCFGNLFGKKEELKNNVQEIDNQIDSLPFSKELREKERILLMDYHNTLRCEEIH